MIHYELKILLNKEFNLEILNAAIHIFRIIEKDLRVEDRHITFNFNK